MRASTAIVILCLAAEVALSVALPLPVERFKYASLFCCIWNAQILLCRFERSDPAGESGRPPPPFEAPKAVNYPFPLADKGHRPPPLPPIGDVRPRVRVRPLVVPGTGRLDSHASHDSHNYEPTPQYSRYPPSPNSKSPASHTQLQAIHLAGVPPRDPLSIIPPTSHTPSQPLPGSRPPTNSLVEARPPPPPTSLAHPHLLSPESSSNPPVSPPQGLPFESPPQQHGPAGKPPDPLHPKHGLSGRGSGSAPESPPP